MAKMLFSWLLIAKCLRLGLSCSRKKTARERVPFSKKVGNVIEIVDIHSITLRHGTFWCLVATASA